MLTGAFTRTSGWGRHLHDYRYGQRKRSLKVETGAALRLSLLGTTRGSSMLGAWAT